MPSNHEGLRQAEDAVQAALKSDATDLDLSNNQPWDTVTCAFRLCQAFTQAFLDNLNLLVLCIIQVDASGDVTMVIIPPINEVFVSGSMWVELCP